MHGHEPDAADRILREALRRSDADRAAYLHEVCAGQPELQLEVERLLSSVTQAYDIGEEPTRPGTPDLGGDRYVIQELIGQGGMGQVYRAEDRQLGRIVAIKAIRPGRASTPEVMHRLAREARLAASLNHPFICKVHELIQLEDGQVFFVMEYVEGETLRAVLKKGPLELSNAVRVGREMAEALSFAHEHGLVHRDVKPANVMVTSHGHIKVMDFGIAKVLDVPGASTTTAVAEAGRIIGTPAYMSPEQAAGEPVDQRSDIFSFGVVFYQCLTGELPFEGTSVAEYRRHAAIGETKPLPKRVPAELRTIVQQCLEKKPEQRPANLETVRKDLGTAALSLLSSTSTLTFRQRLRLGPRPWVAVVILLAVAAAAAYAVFKLRRPDEGPSRLLVQRPVVTWPSVENNSRISPDGTVVAFVSDQGGPRLWIRSVTGSEPTPITPVRDAIKTPAWSPDGRQVAHLVRIGGSAWLQIVSVWGEAAEPPRPIGGAWDDVALVKWIGTHIYFSVSSGKSDSLLWRHDLKTASDAQVTNPSKGKLFTTSGATVNVDVRADEARIVFAGSRPDEGLWTADLDGSNAERLAVAPGPVQTPRWKGPDGKRVMYVTNDNGQPDVWEYNLEGRSKAAVTASPLEEETIDVSSSGSVVVADTVEQISHLWALDPAESAAGKPSPVQITNDSRSNLWPNVSRSGALIFHRRKGSFVTETTSDTELVQGRWADGSLLQGEVIAAGTAGGISSDGRRIFFLQWSSAAPEFPELWVKDLDTPNPAVKIWSRFWFPGNHISTWAPLGQNAAWAPRRSDDLFFVRRAPGTEAIFGIVRATLATDLSATIQVLATCRGDQRFLNLAISDDGSRLAVVASSRRPYRGGPVQLLDLRQPAAPPVVMFEAAEGAQLYVKGWTRRGTVLALRSFPPTAGSATEVWELNPGGRPQRVAVETDLLGMTARLDPARDRLFATSVDRGLATVRVLSLTDKRSKTIVSNAVEGITFGGYAVTDDGWLLYMRKETNYNVWVFSLGNQPSAERPQGGNK